MFTYGNLRQRACTWLGTLPLFNAFSRRCTSSSVAALAMAALIAVSSAAEGPLQPHACT